MNVIATSVSLNVADVPAASRFFTTHLGFRELVVAEGVVCLGRDDAAADIVLLSRDGEPPYPQGTAEVIVSFTVSGIAARALMEVGGALIMPSTLSILITVFDDAERRKAMAAWSAVAMLGLVGGPVLGGVLIAWFW